MEFPCRYRRGITRIAEQFSRRAVLGLRRFVAFSLDLLGAHLESQESGFPYGIICHIPTHFGSRHVALSYANLACIGLGCSRVRGFELREEPDRYVLVSKIPEAQAKNVSVNVENDRFVTITTKQDKSSQAGGLSAFSASSSTQSMTLPGPVKVERMTMDYKNGQLEVTLPKA